MKKLFTLVCALMGFVGAVNAATVDDIAVCKHSYVLCFDDWDGNGTAKPGKGQLFGDGYFLDVTGGSVSTGKGKVNLSVLWTVTDKETGEVSTDENHVTQYFVDKYGPDYPDDHFNSWRLKNAQDVIAMRVTAGSKLIFFLQGNNKSGTEARIPKIATDAKLENALNAAPGADHPATDSGFRYEWTADKDMLIYIGSYNGDMFLSYLIVEADEPEGTPSVKVSDQQYEGGLHFIDVTCKPAQYAGMPTAVTYTTDGSDPSATSTLYTGPIRCYDNAFIKFQAYMDFGMGIDETGKIEGAENEAAVTFRFNAPEINTDGANVLITSEYENAKNLYTLNDGIHGEGEALEGSSFVADKSYTVKAWTEIQNGSYATFTSAFTSKDVYVLTPLAEGTKVLTANGEVVRDTEAEEASAEFDPEDPDTYIYKVQDGKLEGAEGLDFFCKNLQYKVVKVENYQVPTGKEAYLQMADGMGLSFEIAEGYKANIKVVCTKNSCKDINANTAGDINKEEKPDDYDKAVAADITNRTPHINLDGTVYDGKDLNPTEGEAEADANIVTIPDVKAGLHTFLKYSGTGNILVSSMEFEVVKDEDAAVSTIKADNADLNAPAYNLAGQRVADSFKGLVIKAGKKFVK